MFSIRYRGLKKKEKKITWHFFIFPLPLFYFHHFLSVVQIGCLSPQGESAGRESPSASQLRHPSTLLLLLTLCLSLGSWSITACQMPVSLPLTSSASVQLSNEILSELQMNGKTEI